MSALCVLFLHACVSATGDFNGRFNSSVTFLVFARCLHVRRVVCVCWRCDNVKMNFCDRL